jgi:DNA-binding HxlR family transcriptional regulator
MVLPIPEQPVPGFQARYPIMAALDLLGRRWILRILWELRHGPMGFRAMQAICDDMSPSTLSQRLSLLQTTGLISHTEERTYSLTGMGQQLLCALAPLQEWAEFWAAQLGAQEETEQSQAISERNGTPMSASQESQPTLDSITPRFLVADMEQALAFYEQLGFATPYHDEGFAILKRDGIALQFNVCDPTHEPSQEGCRVCSIGVTNIEALYQQYVPTGALRSPLQATSWGTKGFWLCDPFRNILMFEERIPEGEC